MKTPYQIFVRILLILCLIGAAVFAYFKAYLFTAILLLFIALVFLVEFYGFVRNVFGLYERTLSAMLQEDFSADFTHHKSYRNYHKLFSLYEKLKEKKGEMQSKDVVFRSILNNIETGVVILQKKENQNEDWELMLMNDYFSSYFKVPKVSRWFYLKRLLPSLCKAIEQADFEEIKTSVQIKPEKQEQQAFLLQTAKSKTYGQEYYIILLDSIQKVVEKREKEAWINLMNVISHELLNSLTPIRSLSQNIYDTLSQAELTEEDTDDIRKSVATMMNRSNHLQRFVESYRKLAMLPSPKRRKVFLQTLIDNSTQIMQPLLNKNGVHLQNKIVFNRQLFVDIEQIEQVFINLITNSIYALSESETKKITLSAEVKDRRLLIHFVDNGKGIEKEIEDKVFLPFYTTRQGGGGIGLTLSKNIVESHGGYLTFYHENNQTIFTVCLPEH